MGRNSVFVVTHTHDSRIIYIGLFLKKFAYKCLFTSASCQHIYAIRMHTPSCDFDNISH